MNNIDTIDWEISQLVESRLFPDRQAVLRNALRALFQIRPGLRLQMIIRTYTAGEISLGRAAMLMGVSHSEMKDILLENDVKIHLGPLTPEELQKDAENA
jgi:predicted HTH domain antitoxin